MVAELPADATALEAAWRTAVIAKDKPALDQILHLAFELITTRSGVPTLVGRDAWLSALDGLDVDTVDTRLVQQAVLPHTIVSTMEACWKVRYRGQRIDERVLVTDVWVREDGRWQVIRRHSSLIPVGAKIS